MNYISSLLVDEYGVNQDISIYISMLAPFAILFGPILAINSCNKNRNFIGQIIKFLLFALPCPLLLAFFYGANMFVALLFILVFIVMVKGAMEIILSIINFKMRNFINAGGYSAISNGVASFAAGIAPAVIGWIIDISGWKSAYLTVFGLALFIIIALVIINIIVVKDDKNIQKNEP